jgi:hypothetical protein
VYELYVFSVSIAPTPFNNLVSSADSLHGDDNLDLQIPDRQNCALYSIPFEGEGMTFMNPFLGEWFSDRGPAFKGSTGCYQPGDQVAGPTDFGPRIFG